VAVNRGGGGRRMEWGGVRGWRWGLATAVGLREGSREATAVFIPGDESGLRSRMNLGAGGGGCLKIWEWRKAVLDVGGGAGRRPHTFMAACGGGGRRRWEARGAGTRRLQRRAAAGNGEEAGGGRLGIGEFHS
jgi:hypothetical protein